MTNYLRDVRFFLLTPRDAHKNPYWHEYEKRHVFDAAEVIHLCRIGFNTILATRNLPVLWNAEDLEEGENPHWEYPLLVFHHQNTAEMDLSGILLKLAVAYRALDDQLKDIQPFKDFKADQYSAFGSFLLVYSDDEITGSLRECCNKIIHADDIRPVYSNNDEEEDKTVWYMTNTIELTGTRGKKEWSVSLDVLVFFEAMLETIQYLDDV
jgi:hypothetical protein